MNDSLRKPHALGAKQWFLIVFIGMAGQIAWNIENSWFNTYVYEKIGYHPDVIAWMVAISSIATTVVTFLFGTLSDRLGKRKTFIVIGYLFWGIATITFGFTELVYQSLIARGLSVAFMVASVFVIGADAVMSMFGSLGNDAGFNAWTTDISNEGNRSKVGGAIAVMPVAATILGTVLSGFIIEQFDYFVFFLIMGGFVMIVGLITLLTLKDAPDLVPKKEGTFWKQLGGAFSIKQIKANPVLFLVFVFTAAYFIGFNVYFPYMLVYMQYTLAIDVGLSGMILGGGLILATIVVIPVAKLIDRGRSVLTCVLAVAVSSIGLLTIFFFRSELGLFFGIFFVGVGYISIIQATTAWMKNLYPIDQRGQFEGWRIVSAVMIPMVFGPMIGSNLIKAFGEIGTYSITETISETGPLPPALLFLVAAILTVISLIPLSFLAKAIRVKSN